MIECPPIQSSSGSGSAVKTTSRRKSATSAANSGSPGPTSEGKIRGIAVFRTTSPVVVSTESTVKVSWLSYAVESAVASRSSPGRRQLANLGSTLNEGSVLISLSVVEEGQFSSMARIDYVGHDI